MDKLLWQALTNLLSIAMTQTGFIVEHAQAGDEEAAAAVRHRTAMFRSIGEQMVQLAEEFESQLEEEAGDIDALYDEFAAFLKQMGGG